MRPGEPSLSWLPPPLTPVLLRVFTPLWEQAKGSLASHQQPRRPHSRGPGLALPGPVSLCHHCSRTQHSRPLGLCHHHKQPSSQMHACSVCLTALTPSTGSLSGLAPGPCWGAPPFPPRIPPLPQPLPASTCFLSHSQSHEPLFLDSCQSPNSGTPIFHHSHFHES